MIVVDGDAARRHACRRKQGLGFPERLGGRARIGSADGHVGDDRAGAFL